jgi:hypothetical protein
MVGPKLQGMSKHQYRLDLGTLQLRDFRRELIATILTDRDGGTIVQTSSRRFAIGTSLSGNERMQWNQLSLWHGVFGWTLDDGSVAVRYVPESKREYLITVERPIDDELRVIATGAFLLKTTGTDSVAWRADAGAVEMRR